MSTEHLADDVIGLLMQLIEIPSFSGEESHTADCIQNWLHSKGVETQRIQNRSGRPKRRRSRTSSNKQTMKHKRRHPWSVGVVRGILGQQKGKAGSGRRA